MALSGNGRDKLMEECGELISELAKKSAYPSLEEHPDGKGAMKERLENEIADVLGASKFVIETHELDYEKIMKRAGVKYKQFVTWHKDPTN